MGLDPFDQDHAKYFFGRNSDSELIAANVLSAGILVLHGPSGVGKSSVLGAALPSALDRIIADPLIIGCRRWDCEFYRALLRDAKRHGWEAYRRYGAKYRWTAEPELREPYRGISDTPQSAPPLSPPLPAVAESDETLPAVPATISLPPPAPDMPRQRRDRRVPKKNSLERLAEMWAQGVGTPVVFVFDQFEQYFIGQDFGSNVEDQEFEADLARIVKRRDLGVHVLISIREDALHELNRLRARIPNILGRSVRLDYLDRDAAREAIIGPLKVWGEEHGADAGPTTAEPELVDELIRQVSGCEDGARIETPYLQLALKRLWQEEPKPATHTLRLATLNALGGASGIAESHFRDTMKQLSETERSLCATIFDRMVTPSGMKISMPATDLAGFANADPEWVQSVLDKLAHGPSRIIQSVKSPKDDTLVLYEIFHDVLARPILDWKRQLQVQQERAEHARRICKEKQLKRKWRYRFYAATACAALTLALAGGLYISRERALQRAQMLAMNANLATERGDAGLALRTALQALPEDVNWFTRLLHPVTPELASALARAAYRPLGPVLAEHRGSIVDVGYSADGRTIATASEDETVRLWDADSGDRKFVLKHAGRVTSVSFSARSERLVTAAEDGFVRIWDSETGKELVKWRADSQNSARFAEFGPGGDIIATAGRRNSSIAIWRWDGEGEPTPAAVSVLGNGSPDARSSMTSLAFHPSGSLLVTTAWDRPVRIWNIDTGKLAYEFTARSQEAAAPIDEPTLSARFSHDGRRIVTVSRDGKIRIWALPIVSYWSVPVLCASTSCVPLPADIEVPLDAQLRLTFKSSSDRTTSAEFDSTGDQLITASVDGAVRLWDASTGELLRLLQGPATNGGFRAVATMRPDGQQVVASFAGKTAHVWSLTSGLKAPLIFKLPGKATAMAVSRDDRRLATAVDSAISVFDTATNQKIVPDFHAALPVMSVAFDRSAGRLAAASGRSIEIWNLSDDPAMARTFAEEHSSLVLSLAYDPSGQRIVTASQDGTARIWDAATGTRQVILAGHAKAVFGAVFSEDGHRVATGSFDRTVRIWNAATGRLIGNPIQIGRPVLAVAWPRGKNEIFVTTLEEPTRSQPYRIATSVWNASSGDCISESEDRTLRTANYIIHGSPDGSLRIMDRVGNTLALLPQHRNAITEMAAGSGGELLYTTSVDGTIRAWKLVPSDQDRLIRFARESVMTLRAGEHSFPADQQRAAGLLHWRSERDLDPAAVALGNHSGRPNRTGRASKAIDF